MINYKPVPHLISDWERGNLSPHDQAKKFWERDDGIIPLGFDEVIRLHTDNGGCKISDDKVFLLMKLVEKGADLEKIINPYRKFDNPNCIFIIQMAGDLVHGLCNYDILPENFKNKPYIMGLRDGEPKYWKYSSILRLAKSDYSPE